MLLRNLVISFAIPMLIFHVTTVAGSECVNETKEVNATKEEAKRNCTEVKSSLASLSDIASFIRCDNEKYDKKTFWVEDTNITLHDGTKLKIKIEFADCYAVRIQNGILTLFNESCKNHSRYICRNKSDIETSSSSPQTAATTTTLTITKEVSTTTEVPTTVHATQPSTASEPQEETTAKKTAACEGIDIVSFFIGFCIGLLFFIVLAVKHVLLMRSSKTEKNYSPSHDDIAVAHIDEIDFSKPPNPSYSVVHDYENLKQGSNDDHEYANGAYEPIESKEMDDGYITPETLPGRGRYSTGAVLDTDDGYVKMEIGTLNTKKTFYDTLPKADAREEKRSASGDIFSRQRETNDTVIVKNVDTSGLKKNNKYFPHSHPIKKSQSFDDFGQNSKEQATTSNYTNENVQTHKRMVALKPVVKINNSAPASSLGTDTKNIKHALKPVPTNACTNGQQLNIKTTKLTTLSMARRALNPIRKFSKKTG